MSQILVFGNSASGKSTLSKHLQGSCQLAHLDLDTVAWRPASASANPERRDLDESLALINQFCDDEPNWVIEGCYADLLAMLTERASEIIYLNLSIEQCIENAKKRPWEPHKYASEQEQSANLEMLINWISDYETRDDAFSSQAHHALFDGYLGEKTMLTAKPDLAQLKAMLNASEQTSGSRND